MYDITSNGSQKRNIFIPVSYSVFNWGGIPTPGVDKPLELEAYTEKPYYTAWDR